MSTFRRHPVQILAGNLRARFLALLLPLLALLCMAWVSACLSAPTSAAGAAGTIAYVRNLNEIRLIEPDGSNDRRLWIEPRLDLNYIINSIAWRPDGAEVTFASNHEQACSIFESDIYSIGPDGTGLRRVTNPPACASLASYPKGNVRVAVRNYSSDSGPFFVYVQGAPGIQMVIVPFGSTTTVTFNGVADFGDTLQQMVAINGQSRWLDLSTAVDVVAGQTVNAGTFTISGAGIRQFGAFNPVWRSDGSQVGFILSNCAGMFQVPAYAPDGDSGSSILNTSSAFACMMDWGPTPALANQILYYAYLGDGGIYRVTEGSSTKGTKLVSVPDTDLVYGLQWLPDGSGFLFAQSTGYNLNINLYEYNFGSATVTPRTSFSSEFVRSFALSPDGQTVVFERAASLDAQSADLWLMKRDGTQMRLLVSNGRIPVWSWRTPPVLSNKLFLPMLIR